MDSLSAMDLRNLVQQQTGLDLPVQVLLECNSVQNIGEYLEQHTLGQEIGIAESSNMSSPSLFQPTARLLPHAELLLSHEQQLFWTHFSMYPRSTCYNMGYLMKLQQPIDLE